MHNTISPASQMTHCRRGWLGWRNVIAVRG